MMKMIGSATLFLALAVPAFAQEKPEKKDDTLNKAGQIATQPVRDIDLDKDKIPEVLQRAVEYPYAPPASRTCRWTPAGRAPAGAAGTRRTRGAPARRRPAS